MFAHDFSDIQERYDEVAPEIRKEVEKWAYFNHRDDIISEEKKKARQYSYYKPTRNFTGEVVPEMLLKRHDDGTFRNVGYR